MQITSVALPETLVERIDQTAAAADRSRSYVIKKLLEHSLTAADRATALDMLAAAEVAAANAPRARAENAGQLIAESCADGRARLDGLSKIARSNT